MPRRVLFEIRMVEQHHAAGLKHSRGLLEVCRHCHRLEMDHRVVTDNSSEAPIVSRNRHTIFRQRYSNMRVLAEALRGLFNSSDRRIDQKHLSRPVHELRRVTAEAARDLNSSFDVQSVEPLSEDTALAPKSNSLLFAIYSAEVTKIATSWGLPRVDHVVMARAAKALKLGYLHGEPPIEAEIFTSWELSLQG